MRLIAEPQESASGELSATPSPDVPALAGRAVAALVAALLAAWLAAGSMGLWAHALRHLLSGLCLAVVLAAWWPSRKHNTSRWWTFAAAVALAFVAMTSAVPLVNLLAVVLVLAAVAWMQTGLNARAAWLVAWAAMVLALFRLACLAIPPCWSLVDELGRGLGSLASRLSGQPLWIGSTFAGLDVLVLMGALGSAWLTYTPRPRRWRAVLALAAILGAHLAYLVLLSYSPKLAASLPPVVQPPKTPLEQTPLWHWQEAVRSLLPWGLPLLAAGLQAIVAAAMFGWTAWTPLAEPRQPLAAGRQRWVRQGGQWQQASDGSGQAADFVSRIWGSLSRDVWLAALAAALIPIVAVLAWSRTDLSGKTIVAYDKGNLDWLKPQHDHYGRQSAGLYGMLPALVESLGGRFLRSADLSPKDLAAADMLLLIHPDQPWTDEQRQRVWNYVSAGGSLLVAAHSRIDDEGSHSSFNEILEPTGMLVRYDQAISETGRWRQSMETSFHAAAAGVDDSRDQFGIQAGASIRTHWPARPIVVGRWGWSEPGSDATAQSRYEAGKKLGDLVLAAEQPYGRGRIAVLADASVLMNESCPGDYLFVGRLFGYLTRRGSDVFAWWRQIVGGLAIAGLLVLLARRPKPSRVGVAAATLAGSLAACTAASAWIARVLPDGRGHTPNSLAYIDAAHLEVHCGASWYDRGINGLALNLMRNGYLPLLAPDLSEERLQRAGLLISMAPARPFSSTERAAVRRFVEGGGVFISMVGAEDTEGSRELLADFAFQVPRSPVPLGDIEPEQEPMGARVTPYAPGSKAEMMLYEGWEVRCTAENAAVRVRGDAGRPVVVTRPVGKGIVAVIGDSKFALNMNLEQADGQPIFGQQRNPLFWRWFLTVLTGQTEWIPPNPGVAGKAPEPKSTETPPAASAVDAPAAQPAVPPDAGKSPSNPHAAPASEITEPSTGTGTGLTWIDSRRSTPSFPLQVPNGVWSGEGWCEGKLAKAFRSRTEFSS